MKTALFSIVLLVSSLVFAIEPNEPNKPADPNSIAVLQAKIATLEKTLEQKNQLIAKLKKELAQLRNGSDPNSPQQPRVSSMTTSFKLPLVVGRTYRLGEDNKLTASEVFKNGTYIAILEVPGKTVDVWIKGSYSFKPKTGMEIKYDGLFTVTGMEIYNNRRLYVIEPR